MRSTPSPSGKPRSITAPDREAARPWLRRFLAGASRLRARSIGAPPGKCRTERPDVAVVLDNQDRRASFIHHAPRRASSASGRRALLMGRGRVSTADTLPSLRAGPSRQWSRNGGCIGPGDEAFPDVLVRRASQRARPGSSEILLRPHFRDEQKDEQRCRSCRPGRRRAMARAPAGSPPRRRTRGPLVARAGWRRHARGRCWQAVRARPKWLLPPAGFRSKDDVRRPRLPEQKASAGSRRSRPP